MDRRMMREADAGVVLKDGEPDAVRRLRESLHVGDTVKYQIRSDDADLHVSRRQWIKARIRALYPHLAVVTRPDWPELPVRTISYAEMLTKIAEERREGHV